MNFTLEKKHARSGLRNDHLTAMQIARFYNRVREFYGQLLKSRVHCLPVASSILSAVQFLDPSRKTVVTEKAVMKLKKTFPVKRDHGDFLLEWCQFLSEEIINSSNLSLDRIVLLSNDISRISDILFMQLQVVHV